MTRKHIFFVAMALVLTPATAIAAPYLHVQIEYSNARSQGECQSFAKKAAAHLASKTSLEVYGNGQGVYNTTTTLYVDCIFVGRSEQRAKQWIYYISSASTNADFSKFARNAIAKELTSITLMD